MCVCGGGGGGGGGGFFLHQLPSALLKSAEEDVLS